MDTGPERDESEFIARRRKANIRLAICLALVAAAVYFGFIVSHM